MNATATECSPPDNDHNHAHPLSVLYVDDEPVMLNICKQYLERRSDIAVTTALSVEQALILLDTSGFDVIISDYQMPVTDGIGFLKILQERKCPIPFILFTGRGREEVVIEAINNGATYYIQKGGDPKSQFAELNHKIREASRRRHAEEALLRTELYYHTLFENSGTAIALLDEGLKIWESNAEFSHISGLSRNEIDGVLHLTDIVSPEDIPRILEFCRFLYREPGVAMPPFDMRIVSRDRHVHYLTATIAPVPMTGQFIASFIDHNRLHQLGEEHRKMCAGHGEVFGQSLAHKGNHMPGLREKPLG
jgi:PAS domain S-box-containing protein